MMISRQLLGCILAYRPIYIQHGLHQAIGTPCVTHTSILPVPTYRVGIILEYEDNHTYSYRICKEKASFPITIAAQDAHNFRYSIAIHFNWIPYLPLLANLRNPLQLNTILASTSKSSLSFPFFPSPPLHHHVFRRITRRHHRTRYVFESHGTVLSMQQFRLLDGPNPT